MRQEDLTPKKFISTAVEVSYYLAPRDPGLSDADLQAAGSAMNFKPGELRDAIRELAREGTIERDANGRYCLSRGSYPFAAPYISWDNSPRPAQLYEAIADEILLHIREHGKSHRSIPLGPLMESVARKGYSHHVVEVEFVMMQVRDLLVLHDNAVELTNLGVAHFGDKVRLSPSVLPRPSFSEVVDAVRPFVRGRILTPKGEFVSVSRRVFISHSSRDSKLAELLVEFLKGTLKVDADEEIFCSSLAGHGLAPGDVEEKEILRIIGEVGVVIGLLTPNALRSPLVLMELGAAWAMSKKFILLLNRVDFGDIPSWIRTHAINLEKSASDPAAFSRRLADTAETVSAGSGLAIRRTGELISAANKFLSGVNCLPVGDDARAGKKTAPLIRRATAMKDSLRGSESSRNAMPYISPRQASEFNALLTEAKGARCALTMKPLPETMGGGIGGTFGLTMTPMADLISALEVLIAELDGNE